MHHINFQTERLFLSLAHAPDRYVLIEVRGKQIEINESVYVASMHASRQTMKRQKTKMHLNVLRYCLRPNT